MRKQSRRVLFSGLGGAIVGGVLIVSALSYIGSKSEEKNLQNDQLSNEPTAKTTSEPVATSATTPSPTATPEVSKANNSLVFEKGKFEYVLPERYRIAADIMALDQKNPASSAILTITQGSSEKEKEYVQLINKLQEDRTATEAPQFLPGKTIAIYPSDIMSENSDAKIAGTKKEITTKNGLKGTRYFKVEGLFPYDITYLNFPDGRKIAIQMNYAFEEPFFDETAYTTVVDSIKPQG
jgi:hypothetical protein